MREDALCIEQAGCSSAAQGRHHEDQTGSGPATTIEEPWGIESVPKDVELRVWAYARGIVGTPQYRAFAVASADLERSTGTQELLAEYRRATPDAEGSDPDPAVFDDATGILARVERNEVLMAFLQAQADFVALLGEADNRTRGRIELNVAGVPPDRRECHGL